MPLKSRQVNGVEKPPWDSPRGLGLGCGGTRYKLKEEEKTKLIFLYMKKIKLFKG
jgi:hypothetical protein